MPRIERGIVEGYIYHLLNRGNAKQDLFYKSKDYEVFINLMKEAKDRHPIKIFAYCLMPNHFHIIVMPVKTDEVSKYMQWLMTSHVRRYHAHYGGSGHIWQGRYKSFIIQEENYLLTALRYVEANPVRGNLVKKAKDWKWSSHNEAIGARSHFLVDEVPVELPAPWTHFIDEPLKEKELVTLRNSVNRGTPYGEQSWQVQISRKLNLESTLRPRGRPRKVGNLEGPKK